MVSSKNEDVSACGEWFGLYKSVPAGHAVGICRLKECIKMIPMHQYHAMCGYDKELWAWILQDVRAIEPFPVRGMPGLFEVEIDEGVIAE